MRSNRLRPTFENALSLTARQRAKEGKPPGGSGLKLALCRDRTMGCMHPHSLAFDQPFAESDPKLVAPIYAIYDASEGDSQASQNSHSTPWPLPSPKNRIIDFF
jgi:hypothetical protein